MLQVLREELFRNVGLAFAVVFIVCMILIANVATVLLVVACVVFTLVRQRLISTQKKLVFIKAAHISD